MPPRVSRTLPALLVILLPTVLAVAACAQDKPTAISCEGEVQLPAGDWETISDFGPTGAGRMPPWNGPDGNNVLAPVDLGGYRVHLRTFQEVAPSVDRENRRRYYHAAVEHVKDGRCGTALASEKDLVGDAPFDGGGSEFRAVAPARDGDRLVLVIESFDTDTSATDAYMADYRAPVVAELDSTGLRLRGIPDRTRCSLRVHGDYAITCNIYPIGGGPTMRLSDVAGGDVQRVFLAGEGTLLAVENRTGRGAFHLVSIDGTRQMALDVDGTVADNFGAPALPILSPADKGLYILDGRDRVVQLPSSDPWTPKFLRLADLPLIAAPADLKHPDPPPDVLLRTDAPDFGFAGDWVPARAFGFFVDDRGVPVRYWQRLVEDPWKETLVPTPIGPDSVTFTAVSVSSNAICGLDSRGAVRCRVLYGGDIRTPDLPLVPVKEPLVTIDAGDDFDCGISATRKIYCWYNAEQYVNDVPKIAGSAEVFIMIPFVSVSVGARHACALTDLGNAYCWGDNDMGQLGAGDAAPSRADTPQRVIDQLPGYEGTQPVDRHVRYGGIHAGRTHTCGVTIAPAGDVYCWGDPRDGRLGIAPLAASDTAPRRSPTVAAPRGDPDSFVAGPMFTCFGRQSSREAFCWGLSWYPVRGGVTGRLWPDLGAPIPGRVVKRVAGGAHLCSLTDAGDVYCWGGNLEAQLGRGTRDVGTNVPKPVAGGLKFVDIAASGWRTCGVTREGRIYCWGTGHDPEGPRDFQPGD